MAFKYEILSKRIIRGFYNVYNNLGYGFLEKVYENAFFIELSKLGLNCEKQFPIKVIYDGKEVGEYYADIIVENKIILELKAAENLCEQHEYQLINYLKASNIEIGYLFNFGKKAEFRRKIFSNWRKSV